MLRLPTPRLLTAAVVALALALAVQLHAQTTPVNYPKMSIQPPIKTLPLVELKGYIVAQTDWHPPGQTVYYLITVDRQRYRLELGGARLYLCKPLRSYVGTGKLVIVKGYLKLVPVTLRNVIYYEKVLVAAEVRDPAYPYCRT